MRPALEPWRNLERTIFSLAQRPLADAGWAGGSVGQGPRLTSTCERVLRVCNMGQVKPLRRADRSASRAVACVQSGRHIFGCPGARSDPFQRADETAHLIVQKGSRADVKAEFGAGKAVNPGHVQPVERLDRAVGLTDRGSERREIMSADQTLGGLLHGVRVQVVLDLPDQPLVMGGRRPPHQQPKKVSPLDRRKPGVPVIGDPRAIHDGYGMRLEMLVQRLGEPEWIPVLFHVALRHLTRGVDASIGAPGGGNRVIARLKSGQRRLDRALNRGLVFLALPPGKGGAVIFDFESIARHGRSPNPALASGQAGLW